MRRNSARRPVPAVRPSRRRGPALLLEALEDRTVPTLLGQSLFPADNPWNQNIANAPVAANSTAIINHIISVQGTDGHIHPDFGQDYQNSNVLYGIPYNVVHGNTTAKVQVVIDAYPGESDQQAAPIPANAVIEGDFQNGPRAGVNNRGDSHLIVWDEDNNVAYEFYHASRPSENSDGQWHADQETVWNMKTDQFRTLGITSADAAGLSVLAGLVRPDEGLPTSLGGQGAINHAIRFTLQNSLILDQFLYPASHVANSNTNAAIDPPMGARFRLKSSVDISTLNPESQIVARAMQQYGLILADNGSNFFFSGSSLAVNANNQFTSTWNDSDVQDSVHGLKSLTFSDFEVVDLTPVVTGLSTHSGSAGTTVTVTGQDFSGAAGHLQVLFGGTPASAVTILDDGHASAVAPAGTGTVDVRVQSGVTTTADASQNYTNPIFGYGISATNAGDQFTYGTSTQQATHFSVAAAAGSTAGNSFSLTVTALDANNATVTGYTGTVHFTSSDGQAVLPANYTFTSADAGSHTFTVTLKTAGSDSVTATDTASSSIAGTASVSVSPAAASSFSVAAPTTATAGTAFTVTVTAKDAYGNTATGYRGTVHFTSSDGQAVLPANYAFTSTDNGSHSFSVTLKTAGSDTITATDTTTSSLSGSASVSVNAVPAASLALSPSVTGTTAGTAFSVTVTAKDASGNTLTGYRGTVRFSSSDGQAVLPANYTFTASDNGSHTFGVTLKTAGNDSVTATDTATASVNGTATVSVSPAPAASLTLTPSSTSVTAGTAFTVTLKAKDPYGNAATGYTGKVHFTSSDAAASLPADYTFTAADAGSHAFSVTLKTAGSQSVTATDTASSGLTATASGIQVAAQTGGTNVAPQGTAYRWWGMSAPTATTHQTKAPGLNDGNLTTSVSLSGSSYESPNRYEAGGVIWSTARSINRVVFVNGAYTSSGDGVFDANLTLQFTTNGTTWQNASGWSLSPAYAYDSPSAGGVTYTFSGATASVLGLRVVGQIYTATNSSWYELMNEVEAFTPSGTSSAVLAGGQTSGSPSTFQAASVLLATPRTGSNLTATTTASASSGGTPSPGALAATKLAAAPLPAGAARASAAGTSVLHVHARVVSESTLVGMELPFEPAIGG